MPNYESLKEDYAILDGIPDQRVSLGQIATKTEVNCNTLACGIGWLAFHPKYRAQGYYPKGSGETLGVMTPEGLFGAGAYGAVARMWYGINTQDARYIFATRDGGSIAPHNPYDPPRHKKEGMSDKQLLLHRIKEFLRKQGEL